MSEATTILVPISTDKLSDILIPTGPSNPFSPEDINSGGIHQWDSAIVGLSALDHNEYKLFAQNNPAFLRFGNALYFDNPQLPGFASTEVDDGRSTFKMIPVSMAVDANRLSSQLYLDYCTEHDLDPQAAIDWGHDTAWPGITLIHEANLYQPWSAEIIVDIGGMVITHGDEQYFNPSYLVALHELDHAERIFVGTKDEALSEIDIATHEIAPVLEGIINRDAVYKEIEGIPLDEIVEYPELLPTGAGEGINLGLVANTFRELRDQYGSIEAALMSDEGMAFVAQYYSNEISADEIKQWNDSLNASTAKGVHAPTQAAPRQTHPRR